MTESVVKCQHCGRVINQLESGYWIDQDGYYVCVKSPTMSVRDAVLHKPMPTGLAGEAS